MSAMASRMSRSAPRSPAACRKAAGTSLVADIGRKGNTSTTESLPALEEVLHEADARPTTRRAELPMDERRVARQVRSPALDGFDDPVGVDDLRSDHLGPVVKVEPGVDLVRGEVPDEKDDRA